MSKYTKEEGRSKFENITIDNVYASICPGTVDVIGNYSPLISIGPDIDLKNIKISNVVRNEKHCSTPTIGVGLNSTVDSLSIAKCVQTNETENPITFLNNNGTINKLFVAQNDSGDDELIGGSGTIGQITKL